MDHAGPSDAGKFPFIVMGNKCDMVAERCIASEEAQSWCKENGDIPYFETSALENTAVDEAFLTVVKKALDN